LTETLLDHARFPVVMSQATSWSLMVNSRFGTEPSSTWRGTGSWSYAVPNEPSPTTIRMDRPVDVGVP